MDLKGIFEKVSGQFPEGFGGVAGGEADEVMSEEGNMENCKYTYEMYIQNSLDYTCHTLEWLPHFEK